MFANVFTKTLRDERKSLTGWGIGIALTIVLMALVWPSINEMDIDALMAQYPEAMKEIFNVRDMTSGVGYLNAELFSLMLPAMFIIFAVGRGARLVAGEEDDGTLETLASLPVSRRTVLLEKAGALAVGIGVLALVLWGSIVVASLAIGMDIPPLHAFYGALAMFLMGLEFGLVALALGAATGRRSLAVGGAGALAGLSYLLFIAGQLVDAFRPYLVLSPFHQALSEGPMGPSLPPIVLWMAVVGIGVLAAAVPVFDRRDLAV